MKKVEAFVKSIRLPQVMLALHHVEGLTGATVTQAAGFGQGHGADGFSVHDASDLNPIVRIEVFCSDTVVDQVVSAIEEKAHTGLRGDGRIFVSPVEQAVRISTGERGSDAI